MDIQELAVVLDALSDKGLVVFFSYLGYKVLSDAAVIFILVLAGRGAVKVFTKMIEEI